MARFKMTHTKEEFVAGIKRRAQLLRRLGVIGSTGHLALNKSGKYSTKPKPFGFKDHERTPSLKALEAFTGDEDDI